ncbi:PREDICTED: translation initiation factor IF-2 [Chinchilla lanigera]|uniref:translation initiation factor IF-2 n=1 Tax=Chinchilla lanigera TaxID=34839 RepID=UPI000697F33E|nr:PREDICTED: translation initiation factor IF-2 [Chinchilla lanigera]
MRSRSALLLHPEAAGPKATDPNCHGLNPPQLSHGNVDLAEKLDWRSQEKLCGIWTRKAQVKRGKEPRRSECQVTPGYGCGQPRRWKEWIGALLLAGWCKDFLRAQEGSAVQQVTKAKDFSEEMASDFKIPYTRSIWFSDIFNLADMGTLKNYSSKKLNLKGAVAAKGNHFPATKEAAAAAGVAESPARPGVNELRGSRAHPSPRSTSSSAAASFPSSWLHSPSQPPRSRSLPAQGSSACRGFSAPAGPGPGRSRATGAEGRPLHRIRKRPHQQGGSGDSSEGRHRARPFPPLGHRHPGAPSAPHSAARKVPAGQPAQRPPAAAQPGRPTSSAGDPGPGRRGQATPGGEARPSFLPQPQRLRWGSAGSSATPAAAASLCATGRGGHSSRRSQPPEPGAAAAVAARTPRPGAPPGPAAPTLAAPCRQLLRPEWGTGSGRWR